MGRIQVLDCTLRDGGYINDWHFGRDNIASMLYRLTSANIDIVECGFLEDLQYSSECTLFSDVEQIQALLPLHKGETQYVAMTRFGHLDVSQLKPCDGNSIEGIRVTFHEEEMRDVIPFCRQIQDKGYKVFVQPVGTTSYTDKYLLELVEMVNDLKPYAFYIVDTLGLMRQNDLLRMFYLLDNNLNRSVAIGFHSHNNLQLSFSNAQILADIHTTRIVIVDSSVYGMGRGAGNLNTELITQHLNTIKESDYVSEYLLEIVDDIVGPLLDKYTWGYSVPYYLAAINNCHPNYASYLINRKTLTAKSISIILSRISSNERDEFNESHIAELYIRYQQTMIDDSGDIKALTSILLGREVLIVAPGPTVRNYIELIDSYIADTKPVIISVNHEGNGISPHLCFFSNDKRFQRYKEVGKGKQAWPEIIVTSNVKSENTDYKYRINYSNYLNSKSDVNDNATLMLLSLLCRLNVSRVALAGFDGFNSNSKSSINYYEEDMETSLDGIVFQNLNKQISEVVREYRRNLELQFLTPSVYEGHT